jgi:hypothetical protein
MFMRLTFFSCVFMSLGLLVAGLTATRALAGPAYTDPAQAGPDYAVQGEYVGHLGEATALEKVGLQVVALGHGQFEARLYTGGLPGAGWKRGDKVDTGQGKTADGATTIGNGKWSAKISGDKVAVTVQEPKAMGELTKIERKSPTLGAKPPAGAVVLFDGTSADQWTNGKLVQGHLLNWGVTSKRAFKDYTLHIEFRCAFMPEDRGQGRSNSGVYNQSRYEIQVLDSFGLEGKDDDCGAIYKIALPKVNMSLPPLVWQTYDADFTAAKFDGGKKTKDARITVRHNGVLTIDDHEIPHTTTAAPNGQESDAPGPFYLQDHGSPVVFRNIWVVEKK